MRIITDQLKILEAKVVDLLDRRVQLHPWERARLTGELKFCLFHVVAVEVQVSEGVYEFARLEAADLRDHQCEQRVAGDVEGDAKEKIGAALVELATQFAVADVKLKQAMAGRQCHAVNIRDVPRADDEPSAVGIFFDLLNDFLDLVNTPLAGANPGTW